jgi:hypothetical protein
MSHTPDGGLAEESKTDNSVVSRKKNRLFQSNVDSIKNMNEAIQIEKPLNPYKIDGPSQSQGA